MSDAPTTPIDITGLAVAIGRIEERQIAMSNTENRTDDRLSRVESGLIEVKAELTALQAVQKPRTPWYAWVGGIGAILLLIINAWAVLNLGVDLASAIP